jgi:hypothetical protein
VIASGTLASRADQRTHAIGYVTDSIKRLKAGNLGVEAGFGILVEELESVLGTVTPVAVYLS